MAIFPRAPQKSADFAVRGGSRASAGVGWGLAVMTESESGRVSFGPRHLAPSAGTRGSVANAGHLVISPEGAWDLLIVQATTSRSGAAWHAYWTSCRHACRHLCPRLHPRSATRKPAPRAPALRRRAWVAGGRRARRPR